MDRVLGPLGQVINYISIELEDGIMIDYAALNRALKAFEQYANHNIATVVKPRRQFLTSLSREDVATLNGLKPTPTEKLDDLTAALKENQKLASAIVQYSRKMIDGLDTLTGLCRHDATVEDHAIVRSTIRGVYRDWSNEANNEIRACVEPIQHEVRREFESFRLNSQDDSSQPSPLGFSVLVPGAGLCRIAYELSVDGFRVEANELSYHQLLAANYILGRSMPRETANPSEALPNTRRDVLGKSNEDITYNRFSRPIEKSAGILGEENQELDSTPCQFKVYPWCTQFSNHVYDEDQFRSHMIPNVFPTTTLKVPPTLDLDVDSCLSFVANNLTINSKDFVSMAADPSLTQQYHVLVTCFFVDTAPNLLDYVRSAQHVLKSGGLWINIGPYLWNCYENGQGGRREGDHADDDAHQARQVPRLTAMLNRLDPGEDGSGVDSSQSSVSTTKPARRPAGSGVLTNDGTGQRSSNSGADYVSARSAQNEDAAKADPALSDQAEPTPMNSNDGPSAPNHPVPGPNPHPLPLRLWDGKLEFSHDQVLQLLTTMGFTVEGADDGFNRVAGFNLDENGLLLNKYRLATFKARKPSP